MIQFNMYLTLMFAVLAVELGAYLRKKIYLLERFCVPAPVIGGLIFAITTCMLYVTGVIEVSFDDTLREVCMVFFFTSVGFQANIKILKAGGKDLLKFLSLVILLIILQNILAIFLSDSLQINPLVGIGTGSIPMVGGHGTAGAFGPILEKMGIESATTICTAAATFGLIAGSLMGGPLANRLVRQYKLQEHIKEMDDSFLIEESAHHHRDSHRYAPATWQIIIAIGLGTIVSNLLSLTGLTFPIYIGAMIVAAIIRNVGEITGKYPVYMAEINNIGGIALNLFLGMAMITLKIWQLANLALPLVLLLLGQTILMYVYARFVVFYLMGRDYDAAVIAAGTCGFGMGATPNAMANMQAVCDKYTDSIKAFILIPIVGSLFADFLNTVLITIFINLL